jgi:hypothetical protein
VTLRETAAPIRRYRLDNIGWSSPSWAVRDGLRRVIGSPVPVELVVVVPSGEGTMWMGVPTQDPSRIYRWPSMVPVDRDVTGESDDVSGCPSSHGVGAPSARWLPGLSGVLEPAWAST